MSIIDTDIDTDRRPMIEHKRNKQIPTDKRRRRRPLGYINNGFDLCLMDDFH